MAGRRRAAALYEARNHSSRLAPFSSGEYTPYRRLFHRSPLFAPNSITTAAHSIVPTQLSVIILKLIAKEKFHSAKVVFSSTTREIAISDCNKLQIDFHFFDVSCWIGQVFWIGHTHLSLKIGCFRKHVGIIFYRIAATLMLGERRKHLPSNDRGRRLIFWIRSCTSAGWRGFLFLAHD